MQCFALLILVTGTTASLTCESVAEVYHSDGCCGGNATSTRSLYRYESVLSKYVSTFTAIRDASSSAYEGATISIHSIKQLGPTIEINVTMVYQMLDPPEMKFFGRLMPLPCLVDNYWGSFNTPPISCFHMYFKDDRVVFHFDCSDANELCLVADRPPPATFVPHVEFLVPT